MRLENLYSNFGLMSVDEQQKFISDYRFKRQMELDSTKQATKVKSSVKGSKIELSDDEKTLMKLLGIKAKDIEVLRNAANIEEHSQNDEAIFADDTFEEEEYE